MDGTSQYHHHQYLQPLSGLILSPTIWRLGAFLPILPGWCMTEELHDMLRLAWITCIMSDAYYTQNNFYPQDGRGHRLMASFDLHLCINRDWKQTINHYCIIIYEHTMLVAGVFLFKELKTWPIMFQNRT